MEYNLFETKVKTNSASHYLETRQHSWYGHFAHVIRSDNRCIQCQIRALFVMSNHQVGVELLFWDNGKRLRKVVSPILVAATRLLWLNREIVSEEDEGTNTVLYKTSILPDLFLLPTLGKILTVEQSQPLKYVFAQTKLILRII
jgi:hypothetical protein